ncbi:MAG: type II toxin-antitoxin system HicA family toxin [Candidatus Eremiobacteraeota bacterium]|nr:type II toxin-antitoxin system HicA family toxin [Candidatus Eremiobacteraeota bacterium]
MPKLPLLTSRELVRALRRAGFEFVRQSGSHAIYQREDGRFANVPIHDNDIPLGTLRAILKTTGISAENLKDLR